jgi:hypothetical protein
MVGVLVNGENFAQGDTLSVTPSFFGGPFTLGQGISPTQISLPLNIGSAEYSPGLICVTVTTAQGNSSNTSCIAFVGNQNLLAVDPTGEFYLLDPAQGVTPTSSNGFVRKFKPDGTPDGSFWVGGLMNGIAVDDKTGYVVVNGGTYDPTTGEGVASPANDGNPAGAMGDAAKSGQGCIVRPSGNIISFYTVGQNGAPLYSVTVGVQPWACTMVQLASELDAVVYSRGDTALWKVSASDRTVRGSVALTGITPVTNFGSVGGWQLKAFDSGPQAGTAVLLAQGDRQLVFADIGTMSVTKQIDLKSLLGSGIFPLRLSLDNPGGNAIVAAWDADAGIARSFSLSLGATGAVTMTTVAATWQQLPVGFGASAAGTQLGLGQRGAFNLVSTSAVQPKAMTGNTAVAHATAAVRSGAFVSGSAASAPVTSVPELALSVSRIETKPGKAVFLSWSAKDVTSCFAFGDWNDGRPTKGAETVLPKQEGTFTYSLACTGEDGDTEKSVTLTVRENPAVLPPTLEVSAPAKVRIGESAAIRWSTTNADHCDAGDLGVQPTNGSAFVASPIPGTFTETLTCKGPGGTVSRSITLTVAMPSISDLF